MDAEPGDLAEISAAPREAETATASVSELSAENLSVSPSGSVKNGNNGMTTESPTNTSRGRMVSTASGARLSSMGTTGSVGWTVSSPHAKAHMPRSAAVIRDGKGSWPDVLGRSMFKCLSGDKWVFFLLRSDTVGLVPPQQGPPYGGLRQPTRRSRPGRRHTVSWAFGEEAVPGRESRHSSAVFPHSRHGPAGSGQTAGNADRAVLVDFRRFPVVVCPTGSLPFWQVFGGPELCAGLAATKWPTPWLAPGPAPGYDSP